MPKTYREFCQQVCLEANVAGGASAITTVAGNSGQKNQIVNFVKQAWTEIQNRHQHSGLHWRFMRSQFQITTVASQESYAYDASAVKDVKDYGSPEIITRFRRWMLNDAEDPPAIYLQSAGQDTQTDLVWMDWEDFKYIYKRGVQNDGYPAHITVSPSNKIYLGPAPNDVYIASGDYLKSAQILANDADIPDGLPEAFEDIIVYRALMKFGLVRNASETIALGDDHYSSYMGDLEADQLSEIYMGEPLA